MRGLTIHDYLWELISPFRGCMPHDRHGNYLKPGDVVIIRAKVKYITPQNEYCNCCVETVEPMPPYPTGSNITNINTNQLELVKEPAGEMSAS